MKLDDRIPDRKYIFDCFSADKAKEYIGENCYLTDDFPLFEDLDFIQVYKLDAIDNHQFFNETDDRRFDYCLPVRFVKPEEKFVPFVHLDELAEAEIEVGKVISIRNKNDDIVVAKVLVTEINYNHEDNEVINITLGATGYEFPTLCNSYLLKVDGEWVPFGVKEE